MAFLKYLLLLGFNLLVKNSIAQYDELDFPSCRGYTCGGQNEEFNECGSACGDNCERLFSDLACIEVCVPACQCIAGYARNPEGICVPRNQCPCPSVYDYASGQYYTLSCSKFEEPKSSNRCLELCDKSNIRCNTADLIFGCYCKEGYCRDANKRCVKAK